MRQSSRLIILPFAICLIGILGFLLMLNRVKDQAISVATAPTGIPDHPTPNATQTLYPHPPPPVGTVVPPPPAAESCPSGTFTVTPGTTPFITMRLDGYITGTSLIVEEYSHGLGTVTNGWVYVLVAGVVTSPSTYAQQGFILVSMQPEDSCAYNLSITKGTPFPVQPSKGGLYLLSGQTGYVSLVGINGAILAYTTSKGQIGHFDYTSGLFKP